MPSEHIEQSLQRDTDEHDDTRETALETGLAVVTRRILCAHLPPPRVCVVLLNQHSSIRMRQGCTCKQGRAPSPTPPFQGRCLGYVPLPTLNTWGRTYEQSP